MLTEPIFILFISTFGKAHENTRLSSLDFIQISSLSIFKNLFSLFSNFVDKVYSVGSKTMQFSTWVLSSLSLAFQEQF